MTEHVKLAPGAREWRTMRGAMLLLCDRRLLRRTLLTALIVGTILSAINQGHLIAGGDANAGTWLRVTANYIVPFIVSNVGALAATRR